MEVTGTYALAMPTGTMAAGLAAGSEIFQFRWTSSTKYCAITEVYLAGMGSITAFAAGVARFSLVVARGWSGDGTGGTLATLTGNNQKILTGMATTALGGARITTTAALGVGLKNLDAQDIGMLVYGVGATPAIVFPRGYLFEKLEGPSLILSQNEGIVVRANVPATGTWITGIVVRWAEIQP